MCADHRRNNLPVFPFVLRQRYPHLGEKEGLEQLLKDNKGGYRGAAKAIGMGVATVHKWAYRWGIITVPPPGIRYADIAKRLLPFPGKNCREKLRYLRQREGKWRKVAVVLGIQPAELKEYRYLLGIVPVSSFRARCNMVSRNLNRIKEKINEDAKYF